MFLAAAPPSYLRSLGLVLWTYASYSQPHGFLMCSPSLLFSTQDNFNLPFTDGQPSTWALEFGFDLFLIL